MSDELRLHLDREPSDREPPVVSSPEIELALSHWRELNAMRQPDGKPSTWATFEAAQFKTERLVRVRYGSILDDGTKEREIATRTYYLDIITSEPKYWTAVHP